MTTCRTWQYGSSVDTFCGVALQPLLVLKTTADTFALNLITSIIILLATEKTKFNELKIEGYAYKRK
jgi:hypothetical protein